MKMGELRNVILCLGICVFTFNALVKGLPVKNEIQDNSTSHLVGMVTKELPKSVMTLSINVLQKLIREKSGENILFSPLSAQTALFMLHLGASDKTRAELSKVMYLSGGETKDYDKLYDAFSKVLTRFNHTVSNSENHQGPETNFANGLFVHKNYTIHKSYLESVRKYFFANVTNVDFQGHAKEATETINSFISENTKNRIQKLYEDPLPSTTVAVLTNALYFHGVWKHTFNKDQTKMEKFHTGNSEIEVPMMHDQQNITYTHSEVLQADIIELPYKGGEFSLHVVLPRPSQTMKNMSEHFHLYDAYEVHRNTKVVGVDYKFPKMKFSWKNSLVNLLGLEDVFSSADLSRMTAHKVPISDMLQATEIEVDEQGTIASAATAISLSRKLTPPIKTQIKFYVTRPFLMALIHKPTHMVVFDGVVFKPQQ